MFNPRAINGHLQKKLRSEKRDGVSVVEAAEWLAEEGLLDRKKHPENRLRDLLREGKIKGAYQFPNKRWVIVNSSRLPDGVAKVVPIKEAASKLAVNERTLLTFVGDGTLKALDFGPGVSLFSEDELKRFRKKHVDLGYTLELPREIRRRVTDVDKLKRQLYYLRSDLRLLAERIDELIKLLD